jgi:hypothetical protein
MLPEIVRFNKWLRRRSPNAATHVHYTNDLAACRRGISVDFPPTIFRTIRQ